MAAEPARALALAVALAAGCTQSGTGVDVTIEGANLTIDELQVVANFDGLALTQRVKPAAPLTLPTHLLAELPDRPTTVAFDVTGKLAGMPVGHGTSDPIAVAAHQIALGRVSLAPGGGELGPPPDLTVGDAPPADLAAADLAVADLAVADLAAAADLTPPPDLAWTDLAATPIIFIGHGEWRMTSQTSAVGYVSPFAGALQPGDFLLLAVYAEGTQPSATPAGWTLVGACNAGGGTLTIYYKRAGAAESDVTVQLVATANLASSIVLGYRNVRAATPLDAYTNPPSAAPGVPMAGNQIIFSAPSITTTRPGDRLVAFYLYRSGGGEVWNGVPANLSLVMSWQELAAYHGTLAVPGATGVESATASFSPGIDGTSGGEWLGALAPLP